MFSPLTLSLCWLHLFWSPQIILCSYMCVEAFMIASRHGYPVLPCAPFDAKNPPAANLLWLFYISKVCRTRYELLRRIADNLKSPLLGSRLLTADTAALFALRMAKLANLH